MQRVLVVPWSIAAMYCAMGPSLRLFAESSPTGGPVARCGRSRLYAAVSRNEASLLAPLWRAVESDPAGGAAWLALARSLRRFGRHGEAILCLERAVALVPNDREPQRVLADLLRLTGREAEAVPAYRRVVEMSADDVEARLALAECLAGTGALDEALGEYERILALLGEGSSTALAARARAARHGLVTRRLVLEAEAAEARFDWPRVIEGWEAMLRHLPGHARATARLVRALRSTGFLKRAEALAAAAIAAGPTDPDLLEEHAWNANAREDWAEALRRWEAAVPLHPHSPWPSSGWAVALAGADRLEEAERVYAEGESRFPGHAAFVLIHPRLAERRGDWAEAARRWPRALALYPDSKELQAAYAAALARLGPSEK
jgi:tetratricopeptide (TPR) repeat protein